MSLPSPVRPLCLAIALALAGCGSIDQVTGNETVDYRTSGNKTAPLDIPPDLTQLSRDPRYAPQGQSVSASAFQAGAAAPSPSAAGTTAVAVNSATTDGRRDEDRAPGQRALAELAADARADVAAAARVLAGDGTRPRRRPARGRRDGDRLGREPRQDPAGRAARRDRQGVRLGLLDRRTRQVPHARRAHARPAATSSSRCAAWSRSTAWPTRARPPGSRVRPTRASRPRCWGACCRSWRPSRRAPSRPAAAVAAASAPAPAARATAARRTARRRPCRSTTASTAPGAASAWRSTAAASPSKTATARRACTSCATSTRRRPGRKSPNFITKLFSSKSDPTGPVRYRVSVKGEGNASIVTVLDNQGAPEKGEAGQRIVNLLLADLK